MVQSLIQRIRENKLDALYLFINESLRDRNEFDVFFNNLMVVLPNNWSINRVEIGHEFLSRTVVAANENDNDNDNNNGNQQVQLQGINNNNESKQDQLFRYVCSLESLRSLIISDGYVPREDHGFVDTKALLRNLPRAHNLQYLDVQRLKLRITTTTTTTTNDTITYDNDAELLAESLDSLRDSLEDLRLSAISLCVETKTIAAATTVTATAQIAATKSSSSQTLLEQRQRQRQRRRRYPLDAAIRVCGEMANLQLLAISCASGCGCNCGNNNNGEDQEQQQQHNGGDDDDDGNLEGDHDHSATAAIENNDGCNSNSSSSSGSGSSSKHTTITSCLISREVLLQLCRSSTTLQELALRSMRIDDDTCKTIAKAFDPPDNNNIHTHTHTHNTTSLISSSSSPMLMFSSSGVNNNDDDTDDTDDDDNVSSSSNNHHSPSFWTSLDLRQNPSIGAVGYEAILSSLERNYDLWCSLMVDNDSFQSKFNALIELNQANRGALIRSPTPEKLAVFLDRLKDDPTALWYFLTIHRDSILHPVIRYLKWKNSIITNKKQQQQQKQQQPQEVQVDHQRVAAAAAAAALSLPPQWLQPAVVYAPTAAPATAVSFSASISNGNAAVASNNNDDDQKEPKFKKLRHASATV